MACGYLIWGFEKIFSFYPNNYAAAQGSVVDPELQGKKFIW
jgi:hypothetical protein